MKWSSSATYASLNLSGKDTQNGGSFFPGSQYSNTSVWSRGSIFNMPFEPNTWPKEI